MALAANLFYFPIYLPKEQGRQPAAPAEVNAPPPRCDTIRRSRHKGPRNGALVGGGLVGVQAGWPVGSATKRKANCWKALTLFPLHGPVARGNIS